MENKEIASHTELLLRIAELKAEKLKQEDELKNAFSGFVDTLDPVSLIKKTIHDFASDQQVQFDAVKIGMNVGANIIIDQVLGKYRSIKGFFSSLVVEKISSLFINNNSSKIISSISKLANRAGKQETLQDFNK